ncbi:MAG: hypothetical protein HKO60_00070, partial [Pseudomonadales bacterium]|nr:hypothetical protein [Pseudomonadales bacterium]
MKNWLATPLLVLAMSAHGQSLLNPDLDNATGETINDAPDSWSIIAGTPDVVDGSDTGGVCNDSDVDVCGIYAPGTSNTLFARLRNSNNSNTCGTLTAEGIEQTVSGLTVGAPYQICFFAINVGKGDNCPNPPEDVDLQIQISGQATQGVFIPYEGTASAPTWDKFCTVYTASSTSHTLGITMPAGGGSGGNGHVFYDTIQNTLATDTDGDGNADVNDPNVSTPFVANDAGNGTAGEAGTYNILSNDDFLPNNDVTNVGTTTLSNLGTGSAAGSVSLDAATGELTYTPTIAEGGTSRTIDYRVCNTEPATDVCADATLTVNVAVATDTDGDGNPDVVDNNDNTPTAVDDSGNATAGEAATFDILANDDFLDNNDANNIGTTAITDLGTGTAAGTIAFNNATGELTYTPTIAEGGTSPTVNYRVCNTDTSVCDTATVTITVAAATDTDNDGSPDVIDANDNTPTALDDSGNGTVSVAGTLDILANDDFLPNNDANNVGTTAITDEGSGTASGTITFDNDSGELTYTPTLAEAGTSPTVVYEVCNTDTSVCDTATVTINVGAANDTDGDGSPDVVDPNDSAATAVDDSGNGTAGEAVTLDILANDDFLSNNDPNNVGTTAITDTGTGTAAGTIVFDNNTGELTYTPTIAEGGTAETVVYQVCNTDTSVCDTATVTITVAAATDTDNDGNPDVTDPNNSTPTAVDEST